MAEKIREKGWIPNIITPSLILAVLGLMNSMNSNIQKNSFNAFDTPKDKWKTMDHIENSAFSKIQAEKIIEHVNNKDLHMPKEEKDLLYVKKAEFDSIVKLDATTRYQMKQELKKINEKLNKINK